MSANEHLDLGGYVLGRLTAVERANFERHLASCPQCRSELGELAELSPLLADTIGAPHDELPAGLRGRTLAAVERAAADERAPAKRRRWQWGPGRVIPVAFAVTAAAAVAFFVGQRFESRDRGPVELLATLEAPTSGGTGNAKVVKTGIGRVIEFRTDELPILPKGEFYELWFVGTGDTLEQPNRISAGTFHPDADGRSHVTFAAAVDPAVYPVLSVTAEPGDGDPRRTGPEVLRYQPS